MRTLTDETAAPFSRVTLPEIVAGSCAGDGSGESASARQTASSQRTVFIPVLLRCRGSRGNRGEESSRGGRGSASPPASGPPLARCRSAGGCLHDEGLPERGPPCSRGDEETGARTPA